MNIFFFVIPILILYALVWIALIIGYILDQFVSINHLEQSLNESTYSVYSTKSIRNEVEYIIKFDAGSRQQKIITDPNGKMLSPIEWANESAGKVKPWTFNRKRIESITSQIVTMEKLSSGIV